MQSENVPLAKLINKYLDGNCSPEEEALLLNWMNQADMTTGDVPLREDMGKLLKLRIDQANGMERPARLIRFFRPLHYAAASILIAAALGMLFYLQRDHHNRKQHESTLSKNIVHEHYKKLINTGNAPALVKLEDGSEVNLQTGSSLLWQVPFSNGNRKVELTGKAFFEVAKNKHKPFIVFSGDISTTALGTSFWVKEQPQKGEIEVELITGKVVIKHHHSGLSNTLAYLTPGQQLTYSSSANSAVVITKTQPVIKKPIIKTISTPALVFTSTPLKEVFAQLQSYYHIKIDYNPKMVETMTFYGTYAATDNVETILNTIATANGLTLKKLNHTFIISN